MARVRGISEEKLKEKRDKLREDIAEMETAEAENSVLVHQATAKKTELRAGIVDARNRLSLIEQHIRDCEELGE